jgi:hypothetical protein
MAATLRDLVRYIVALLSLGAAAIHATVIGEHLKQYSLFGAFFVVVAALQVAWGALVVARLSATVYLAGALGNGLVVALWVVSRTTGLPLGPEPWSAEGVSVIDAMATAYEVVAVVGVVVLLRPAHVLDRRLDPGVLGGTAAVFGTVLAAVTAAAITAHRPEGAASEASGSHFLHLVLVGGGFLGFGIYALLVQWRNRETSQGSRNRGSPRGPDGRKRSLPHG